MPIRHTAKSAWLASLLFLAAPLAVMAEEAPAEQPKEGLPLEELRVFAEVFGRIKADYVEPVEDRQLLKYAIRGMLNGLDPHSAYLTEEDYENLQTSTSGKFGGLGIEIDMEGGILRVIAPLDDTPAQRAGVKAGDTILRLDDEPVKDMSIDEAVKRMRGKVGTAIELTIIREGEDKPLRIKIVRDIIHVVSVRQKLLEPGFGYVRVSQFQTGSPQDMLEAISKLKDENDGPLKGLVLDLRNNPGGVLNAAVSISDAFLEKGLVVYTEGRVKNAEQRFEAGPDDVLEGAPLVVLINGGSASASEIVAGALQDHKRAVIMGQQSFGKGSVQTVVPVTERAAIKMTTARYFTPNGRSIQAEGIVPDIPLDDVEVAVREGEVHRLKESDLAGHLSNGNGHKPKPKAEDDKSESSLAERDYALSEALNLLKGLAILQKDKG